MSVEEHVLSQVTPRGGRECNATQKCGRVLQRYPPLLSTTVLSPWLLNHRCLNVKGRSYVRSQLIKLADLRRWISTRKWYGDTESGDDFRPVGCVCRYFHQRGLGLKGGSWTNSSTQDHRAKVKPGTANGLPRHTSQGINLLCHHRIGQRAEETLVLLKRGKFSDWSATARLALGYALGSGLVVP